MVLQMWSQPWCICLPPGIIHLCHKTVMTISFCCGSNFNKWRKITVFTVFSCFKKIHLTPSPSSRSLDLDDPIDSIWLHHPIQIILGLAAKNPFSFVTIFFSSFFFFLFSSFLLFPFLFFFFFPYVQRGALHLHRGARPPSAPLGYGPGSDVDIFV